MPRAVAASSSDETGEQAKLDELGGAGVHGRQPDERLVQVDQVVGRGVVADEALEIEALPRNAPRPRLSRLRSRARSIKIRLIASAAAAKK